MWIQFLNILMIFDPQLFCCFATSHRLSNMFVLSSINLGSSRLSKLRRATHKITFPTKPVNTKPNPHVGATLVLERVM